MTTKDAAALAVLKERAARGEVTAQVCHELRNALGAIQGWAELAVASPERSGEAVAIIARVARDVGVASYRMLGALTSDAPTDRALNATGFLEHLVRLFAPTAHALHVQVDSGIQPELWVLASPGELFTIVWNLAKNAAEAMPGGGTMGIFAGKNDDTVRIVVADNGVGIPGEHAERVFEADFTTKATGSGIGLGLVRQTVARLGGTLELQSRPKGTNFIVRLPLVARPSDAPGPRASSRPTAGSGLRVLIVDDDRTLRGMVETALAGRGVEVTSVDSVASALASEGPFDLALVDFALADGPGDRLIAELRALGRVQSACLMSGATEPPPSGDGSDWLRKPFGIRELEELIDRVRASQA